jgi:hypothetical protein
VTLIARFTVDGFEPRKVEGPDADWAGLLRPGSARIVHDDEGAFFEIDV